MTSRSPLHQQIDTLPALVQAMIPTLTTAVSAALSPDRCRAIDRVFLTGCGDSHHAPLNAEMAFEQLANIPCEPMTALQFARYGASFLPEGSNLILAVSVSGAVSRTVEALNMGRQAGALAIAVTGNPAGPLAQVADLVLETAVPPLPDEMQGMIVPGTRSYIASLLTLYLTAIHIGEQRGHLPPAKAHSLRRELAAIPAAMQTAIDTNDAAANHLAATWLDADHLVFCGAGPNYGTALFSAAKVLEATGETAVAQDLEEWAHLQYFGKPAATPTILLSAGGRDTSRAVEIATAARHIGRRVAIVAPAGSALSHSPNRDELLAIPPVRECFSPLVTCLPPLLFTASRAVQLGEPYFRGFGGGRSVEGGGGISRIRSSEQLMTLPGHDD